MQPDCPISPDQAFSRRRRKEARPSELTAAALALFVEKGFAATRLEDVAARAGVSKGTLYLYFDSKEALFKAVIEQGLLPALGEGEAMLAQHQGDAASLLQNLLWAWWNLVGATELGGIPKLMVSEAANFPELARYYHDHVIVRGRKLLMQALQRGLDRGEFRPMDVESMVDVLIAPMLMLAIWRYSFAPCAEKAQAPEGFLNSLMDLITHGLRAVAEAK